MEALFGQTLKISKERGKWKELLLTKNISNYFNFPSSVFIKTTRSKKYSWADLK